MTNINTITNISDELNMEELEGLKQKVAECIASKRETEQYIYSRLLWKQ